MFWPHKWEQSWLLHSQSWPPTWQYYSKRQSANGFDGTWESIKLHITRVIFKSQLWYFPSFKVGTPKYAKRSQWRNRHKVSELPTEATSKRRIIDGVSNGACLPIWGKVCTEKHLETLPPRGPCWSSVSDGSHRPQTSIFMIGRCPCQPGEKFQYFIESILQQKILPPPFFGQCQ